MYDSLSRVRNYRDVLLLHKQEDYPSDAATFHKIPVAVQNPFLLEAVELVEGN